MKTIIIQNRIIILNNKLKNQLPNKVSLIEIKTDQNIKSHKNIDNINFQIAFFLQNKIYHTGIRENTNQLKIIFQTLLSERNPK